MFELAFWVLYFYQKLLENARLPPEIKEKIRGCWYTTLYTRQQIRDALNTLYALIVILRNLDAPACLNRIGSNPLEHAFGKARLRCRDIHTMKTFMSGLVAEFLKVHGENALELVAVARGRASVGVDCEPWTQVDPSRLDLDPMNVATCVFELAGLPISLIYQDADDVLRDRYLSEISGILHAGTSPPKPYSPISGSHKQHRKSLSSNQLFLGFSTPSARQSNPGKIGSLGTFSAVKCFFT
jgi:hypothetical protein